MRTLAQWSRETQAALRALPDIADRALLDSAKAGSESAKAQVPVVTGDLQRSIGVEVRGKVIVVGTDDPAAAALAAAGRPIVQRAIEAELAKFPERFSKAATKELVRG